VSLIPNSQPTARLPTGRRGPDVAIVVPTFNERENVEALVGRIDAAPTGVVDWEIIYGLVTLDKLLGQLIPIRLISSLIVGVSGVAIHIASLVVMLKMLNWDFQYAQAAAAGLAMTGNFFLHNALTYSDQRLKQWNMINGLLVFYAVCGLGAAANVVWASHLFERHYSWWLSGLGGVAVGAVWNYAATSALTWRV
jgi:dolichol-phosphate mannosyltransferase